MLNVTFVCVCLHLQLTAALQILRSLLCVTDLLSACLIGGKRLLLWMKEAAEVGGSVCDVTSASAPSLSSLLFDSHDAVSLCRATVAAALTWWFCLCLIWLIRLIWKLLIRREFCKMWNCWQTDMSRYKKPWRQPRPSVSLSCGPPSWKPSAPLLVEPPVSQLWSWFRTCYVRVYVFIFLWENPASVGLGPWSQSPPPQGTFLITEANRAKFGPGLGAGWRVSLMCLAWSSPPSTHSQFQHKSWQMPKIQTGVQQPAGLRHRVENCSSPCGL